MSENAGRYQRSFSGLVGAMLVLVVVVGVFVAFRAVNRNEPAGTVDTVDYVEPARFAAEQARFPLVIPGELPEGWRATSVRYIPGEEESWHVGFLTGDGKYVGLEQADRTVRGMVERFVDEDAEQGGDVTVAGDTWSTWTDSGGDTALVRETDPVTTLVVGTVDRAALEDFAASLTAPPPSRP